MNRAKMRELAENSKRWLALGSPVTDPYDTYPHDLFEASFNEDKVIALLDELDRKDALLRQALGILEASYSENYDENYEISVCEAITKELDATKEQV
jgi:hypothetical protein